MTQPHTRFAIQRVMATSEALSAIERLREKHGDLAFFWPGDRPDGSTAICLTKGELLPSPNDTKLGEIGGCPFYVDAEDDREWSQMRFIVDVEQGAGGGISLEGLEDFHFVIHIPDDTGMIGGETKPEEAPR